MSSQYGLISVMNNREIDAQRAEQENPAPADPYSHLVCKLSGYIEQCWQAAKDAKSLVEQEMLEDIRQREGVYSPSKLAEIRKFGGSEIFMMLTNQKCRAAEGWIRDVLFPPGERPFYIKPTPVPDLPPEMQDQLVGMVMSEAQQAMLAGLSVTERDVFERARSVADQVRARMKEHAEVIAQRMEDKIDDVFVEGAWYDAMEAMISDLVTLPFGCLKGPVIRKKTRLIWRQDQQTGQWLPRASDELTPMFYSPSPLDLYPAPDSTGPDDGYLIERISTRRFALHSMIGVPGYNEVQIRAALREYSKGFSLALPIEQQRRDLQNQDNFQLSPDQGLDILEFNGSVPGSLLIDWGMDPGRVPDPEAEYEATVWKLGRFVVRCVLNEDPLRRRPYMIAHFDKIKGQFHGRGLPRIIRDLQAMCNAAARALSNNMGLSSGPLVEVEVSRLADGETLTNIYPWKQFQTKPSPTTPSPAVRFHNIDSNAQELLAVYTYFSNLADFYSGIQSYDAGINDPRGAAGTASGLSMLMSASSRQIKRVIASIDQVTIGSAERVHTHIMINDSDESLKSGDAEIEARGASSLVVREQHQLRLHEFLQATANPLDSQIIGPDGRAELLRNAAKGLNIDTDRVVPDREAMQQRMQQAMLAAIPQQPQAPAGAVLDAAGNPAGGQSANTMRRSA